MIKQVLRRIGILFFALVFIAGCSAVPISPAHTPNALDPKGPAAAHLANLTWFMVIVGGAIWVLVVALLFAAVMRHRRGNSETPPESHGGDTGRRWIILGGLALPLVVLAIVFGYSTYTLQAVESQPDPAVQVHVIGRRWFWQVKYPDESVETANEIHIPVGVPVQIMLESADVIHSFWVPDLNGKMDAIPTRINSLTIQADKPGIYRGECAEFCGLQHAHMGFMVVAESKADYDNWLSQQSQDASTPSDQTTQQGQQVFVNSGCVFCHTVRGLDDKAIDRSGVDLGPDLTHLASRLTLGGASLTQNQGNLAGWIVDTQHVKPGVLMPNMQVNSQDLQALLAYLQSLH